MSDNQVVSVPRDWLNRVALLQMPLDDLQDQAAEFLAEQHQGEPVAWRGINELGEIVTEWIDGSPPDRMVDLCGNPDSFAKIELAYTHADPAEVERLRGLVDAKECERQQHLEECAAEVNALRAQLAERDALLREIHDGTLSGYARYSKIEAVLSASAEPSAPHEEERWHPLTAPGQIQEGDRLSFRVGSSFICARARQIIALGTDKEEVVYNRKKNHYFVTSMAVDGTSSHKNVMVSRVTA